MRRYAPALLLLMIAALFAPAEAAADGEIGSRRTVWERADIDDVRPQIEAFSGDYRAFISAHKTEREVVKGAVKLLEGAGFRGVNPAGRLTAVKKGGRLFMIERGKALAAVRVGRQPVSQGVRVIAAHIDSVRIDFKQNPLYEDGNLALAQTHYYGGIKKYQWLSRPLSLRGVVVLEGGEVVEVSVGDGQGDPVLVIPDLLAHLSAEVDSAEGEEVHGESLDPVVGSQPGLAEEEDEEASSPSVKRYLLALLEQRYGVTEEDLEAAELSLVPAGPAVDVGLDASMVGGYGQDDRACAYAALRALADGPVPDLTSIVLLVDKEEIGSTGNTGARADLLPRLVGALIESQERFDEQKLRRAFRRSEAVSADVTAAANPLYPHLYDPRNVSLLGAGPVLDLSGAHAEFMAAVRRRLTEANVTFQTGEFGRANESQSDYGTVLPFLSRLGMDAMDLSIPLLSMHAPFEVVSKGDVWAAYEAYGAFLRGR